jgi:hypothetical protein
MLLTCSLVGLAFLLGLFLGAGIHEAGARPEREKAAELAAITAELVILTQAALEAREAEQTDVPVFITQATSGRKH